MSQPMLRTALRNLPLFASGKVRDVYDLGDSLLLVTTDRISAFDVIMPDPIPDKGRVLTGLARHWFRSLRPIVSTHFITCDIDFIADRIRAAGGELSEDDCRMLDGRTTLGIKAKAFPIECVVRGYLAGSLWKEYCQAGGRDHVVTLHGIALPAGLTESARLPEPIFTPATKAEEGSHDENIGLEQAEKLIGKENAQELARISLALYATAADYAREKGLIIADTKFEFGLHNGVITLIDEALTPDSSRFWEAASYAPGRSQPSFDKQFLRDWLETTGWKKTPPAPRLPETVVQGTADRYREAFRRITGRPLSA